MANVSLRKKALANNKSSLYLDYFPSIINPKTGKESRREFLGLQVFDKPKDDIEKAHNKSTLEYADLLRAKRLTQLRDKKYGFQENITYNVDFIAFYASVVEDYYNTGTKSNYASWNASLNYYKAFAGSTLKSHFVNEWQKAITDFMENPKQGHGIKPELYSSRSWSDGMNKIIKEAKSFLFYL